MTSIRLLVLMLIAISSFAEVTEIPIMEEQGVLHVLVRLNDVITLPAILDSGAGDMNVPADIVSTLIRTGTITRSDISDDRRTYVLADGSEVSQHTVTFRELKIGNRVFHKIEASIGSHRGDILLGQSFFKRVASWSINNTRKVLILGDNIDSVSKIPAPDEIRAWKQDWGSGIVGVVTTRPCLYLPIWQKNVDEEIGKRFEFLSYSMIPAERLKRQEDAWYVRSDGYAVTVIGCWSPSAHKIFFFRKSDAKKWEQEDFYVNEYWEEVKLIPK